MRILRILPAVVAVGVGAAGLVTAPAQASLTSPQLSASTYFSHASTCTSTVSSGTSNSTFSDDGNAVTQSQSATGSVSNGTDITQVAAVGKGTVRVTRSGNALATADVTATASSKAVPSSSTTTCSAVTEGYTTTSFGFNVAHSGWLTFSTSGSSTGYAFMTVSLNGTSSGVYSQSYGGRMVGTNQVYLPSPGAYSLFLQYGTESEAVSTTIAKQASLSLKTHVAYTIAGGAPAAATGGGSAYVTLANGRNCGSANVAATFTGKASKVKTAVFYINGVKKKTVQHPSSGTSALVGGLAANASATLKAVLTLKAGGTSTVSRAYLPCT